MAKSLRKPEVIKKDIDRLQKELKDSKDANYYAAQAKKNLKKAGEATKKYGKKAGKSIKKSGSFLKDLLTSK